MPTIKKPVNYELFAQRAVLGDEFDYKIIMDLYKCSKESAQKRSHAIKTNPKVVSRMEELLAAGVTDTVMNIQMKREKLRKIVDDENEHTSNKIKAIETDSKLAGHNGSVIDDKTSELLSNFTKALAGKIAKE